MRRLLIGLFLVSLASPATAQPPAAQEGLALLDAAIAKARDKGGLSFRVHCAAGCVQPRRTLAGLAVSDVTSVARAPCTDAKETCWRIDLERKAPRTFWWSVEIQTRPDPGRPIRRVVIFGP